MKLNEKIEYVKLLNELVKKRELVVSDLETGESLSGKDIRIVCMKGDVIHICLDKSIPENKSDKK